MKAQVSIDEAEFVVVSMTLIILILVISIVLVIFVASRYRTKQALALAQNRLDFEKELRTIEDEVKKVTLNEISSELHDNIGQLLTLMSLQIEKGKILSTKNNPILIPISDALNNTINQVRLLSHSLNDGYIDSNTLPVLIERELNRIKSIGNHSIYFNNDHLTDDELGPDRKTVIFRITQELLNNILKHANAKSISVSIHGKKPIEIKITDDGIGFDLQRIQDIGQGIGIKTMVKRADMAGFQLIITSTPGAGTETVIREKETRL
jgi:signal transduction histidine kinase